MPFAYLDNCATTKVCDEAAKIALKAMTEVYGNPSSLHEMGLEAEKMMTRSRELVAKSLGCEPGEIYFTSGGTESNNLAVQGAAHALKRRGKRIVTTMIEHSSVEGAARKLEEEGFEVVRLKPDSNGAIRPQDIIDAVTPDTILVSIMLVNNETGAVQPVAEAKKAVKAAGAPALVHCDAVQAYGKVRFSPEKLGADLVSVSAHKIHAPKGAGALYVSKKARIVPLFGGGGQERGLRSGTEPVPAIAAFGEAARIAMEHGDKYPAQIRELRNYCVQQLEKLSYVKINSPEDGAPHIVNASVIGIRSEIMLHFLASREIYVSSGSACSKGAKSRVLTAMGLENSRIDSALRISFSRYNTREDVDALVNAIQDGAKNLMRSKQNA